jgi:hypothetical protein
MLISKEIFGKWSGSLWGEHTCPLVPESASQSDSDKGTIHRNKLAVSCDSNFSVFSTVSKDGAQDLLFCAMHASACLVVAGL